jgi:hypothetical protein
VHIVLGLAESDPVSGKLYNSQIILGPAGLVIGRYRKIHTFGPDLNWADVGNLGYQAVGTEWGRIGLGGLLRYQLLGADRISLRGQGEYFCLFHQLGGG